MKKSYNNPMMKVVKISATTICAASGTPTVTFSTSGQTTDQMNAKKGGFFSDEPAW